MKDLPECVGNLWQWPLPPLQSPEEKDKQKKLIWA